MPLELGPLLRRSRTIALVIATPLVANAAVWTLVVQPQHAKTQAARDAHAVAEFRPKLQGLLADTRAAVADPQRGTFSASDSTRVVETVRRLAGDHRVTLGEVEAAAPGAKDGATLPMPVSVRATGSFGKLARWLSDLEAHPGLQIEELSITPETSGSQSVAALTLTAFLRGR
jgi:type II secretory pathway component PulM